MKTLAGVLLLSMITLAGFSQKYYTKSAQIIFDATSAGSPEKIEGVNRSTTCVIDTRNGNMQFAALMKGFSFERALMEEHFNENYVESDKYPKAEFKGDIKDNGGVSYSIDGTYQVKVKGKLTFHGESREIETEGRIIVQQGKLKATADFTILLSDYNISIPGLVSDKVSKKAKISVSCSLEPLKSSTN